MPQWTGQLPVANKVSSSITYFRQLVDDKFLNLIVDNSNLHVTQNDINTIFSITTYELEKFIGICFYMSLISVPGTRR